MKSVYVNRVVLDVFTIQGLPMTGIGGPDSSTLVWGTIINLWVGLGG